MIEKEVSLKPYNTFGIDVNAKYFATFKTEKDLKAILKFNDINQAQKLVLGGGSNLLLTDHFNGVVLKNEISGIEITKETKNEVFLKAGAGEVWHDLVMYAVQHNFGGIENLSLIPGSVGAAPMQNIGAYGIEIKDVFYELEAIDINTLEEVRFTKKRCRFGYRESIFKQDFKDKYIITNVTLKLSKRPKINTSYGAINDELKKMNVKNPSIKDVSRAVINIRQAKLPNPAEIGNSGSFFKNPVVSKQKFDTLQSKFPNIAHYPISDTQIKLAAGWLIDQAGWKGRTFENEHGSYGVHKNQALVLVNYGGAKGQDILNLSNEIIKDIKQKFGVDLEREVNVI
jgi:UDP-N-acetylmuramate dehydrogenase